MADLRSIAIFLFGFLVVTPALSQTHPSCASIASDPDGDGYGWENNASCIVTSNSATNPSFTNLVTGEPVNLVRAQWRPSDFVGRLIECTSRRFDGTSYAFTESTVYEFEPLSQTAPFNGNAIEYAPVPGDPSIEHVWTLDNGIYSGPTDLAVTPWVEIVDEGIDTQNVTRVWLSNQSYTQCSNLLSFLPDPAFVPSGSLQTDNCDYSNAAQFDGWGWDAVAGESCAPTTASLYNSCESSNPTQCTLGFCDYTNAAQYDGWGWNAVSGQSCEPLTATSPCIDSDGDGWGWDGSESCRVE